MMSQRLHTSTRVENISLDPWTRDHRPLWLQAWSGHKHDCSGRIVGFNSADGLNIDRFDADGTIAVHEVPMPSTRTYECAQLSSLPASHLYRWRFFFFFPRLKPELSQASLGELKGINNNTSPSDIRFIPQRMRMGAELFQPSDGSTKQSAEVEESIYFAIISTGVF